MILLIILGSGAGEPAAPAGPEPAGPAPPGVGQLAGQFFLPLGMIYVSIPKVNYVLRIYRYLSGTVPDVSGLWYTTFCDTCNLYLNVLIISVYSLCQYLYGFYCTVRISVPVLSICTDYVLSGYSILWYPILLVQTPSQFPEVGFVSIKCFAIGGGCA